MLSRLVVPASIAITHLAMVGVHAAGRAKFSTPPTAPTLIDDLATYWLWPWMHVVAAGLLMVAVTAGPKSRVLWATGWLVSIAVMGSWGWLTLMWGIDTRPGVSLVGPVLALCAAMTTAAVFVERHARGKR